MDYQYRANYASLCLQSAVAVPLTVRDIPARDQFSNRRETIVEMVPAVETSVPDNMAVKYIELKVRLREVLMGMKDDEREHNDPQYTFPHYDNYLEDEDEDEDEDRSNTSSSKMKDAQAQAHKKSSSNAKAIAVPDFRPKPLFSPLRKKRRKEIVEEPVDHGGHRYQINAENYNGRAGSAQYYYNHQMVHMHRDFLPKEQDHNHIGNHQRMHRNQQEEVELKMLEERHPDLRPSLPQPQTPFDQKFEELCKFKEKNGHFNVPLAEETEELSIWCERMRNACWKFERGHPTGGILITYEKCRRLKEIGFDWELKKSLSQPPSEFEQRLEEIKWFKKKHGHLYVPNGGDTVNLCAWLTKVKRACRQVERGQRSRRIDKRKMEKLEEIGVRWTRSTFEQRIEELKGYRATFGNYEVSSYIGTRDLRDWCHNIKISCRLFEKGGKQKVGEYRMSSERIRMLKEIGFEW